MNRLKVFFRNLNFLLNRELNGSLEAHEQKLDARVDAFEQRVDQRADNYERSLDERLAERTHVLEVRQDERFVTIEQRLDERQVAVDTRLDQRDVTVDSRLDQHDLEVDARLAQRETDVDERLAQREADVDARLEERFGTIETRLDERLTTHEENTANRADAFEKTVDERVNERFAALELRSDERFSQIEQSNDAQMIALTQRVDERFDERVRATDNRFDDRFARTERTLDERFEGFEKRTDERLDRHEKRTDYNLKLNRADILDRTDVMLQIFEQRLDQQRREIKALREQLSRAQGPNASTTKATSNSQGETNGHAAQPLIVTPQQLLAEPAPPAQIQSFRKLAQSSGLIGKTKLPTTDATLYQKILDWKKVSADKLNDFAPDEQEVVDYILSFIGDDAERGYIQQHLRRFVATLQRIPPPVRSTDRLLELGSLLHLAPAIKKFSGYQEIYGADFWESPEKVAQETLTQVAAPGRQPESHTIELRNFNVETDPFPYPDGHFRVVLCCELLEHLQRDPLHMLWECNRVLAEDGFLLLTTPNIASARSLEGLLIGCAPYLLSQYNLTTPADQHNREYAPYEVGLALAAAGFSVVALETEDVWLRANPAILKLLEEVNLPTDMRGDNIFALARKAGAPVERYPKELYIE